MSKKAGRYDARRIQLPTDLNAIFPYLMKGRNDSAVYYPLKADVENLLVYIEEKKGTEKEITFFQAVLLALVKVMREFPELNRYIIGRRLYERYAVSLGFIAKRELSVEGSETNVSLYIKNEEKRDEILGKIKGNIKVAKSGEEKDDDKIIGSLMKLPRFFLRFVIKMLETYDFYIDTPKFLRNGVDPLRCSAYVANLGSVGIDAPYHHLFEWGTCSMFLTIGMIKAEPVISEEMKISHRRMVEFKVTLDERISDGYYFARALDRFRELLDNPILLEEI